jgi:hypothetical protein
METVDSHPISIRLSFQHFVFSIKEAFSFDGMKVGKKSDEWDSFAIPTVISDVFLLFFIWFSSSYFF